MSERSLKIEVFSAPLCNKCLRAYQVVEAVLAEFDNASIELCKVDVVEEIDYAVSLGLRATPAIAFNGRLVFPALPAKPDLREAIQSWVRQHD